MEADGREIHKCEVCGGYVQVYSGREGTNSYESCNKEMVELLEKYDIPFKCMLCGNLHFSIRGVRDVVFLYQDRVEDKLKGVLHLPDFVRDTMQLDKEVGTVLEVGEGYWCPKGRFYPTFLKPGQRVIYDKTVPWERHLIGSDGGRHIVKMMGEKDVRAIVED